MNDQQFREKCRVLCDRFPDVPRLKTIAAIGAYDGEIGGSQRDSYRLTRVAEYLLKSGFVLDPDYSIDVVNFREGRDFLNEDKKADLVFVANILRDRHACLLYWDFEELQRNPKWEECLDFTVSRMHDIFEFQDRFIKAETKLVVTFGGELELAADCFAGPDSLTDHIILVNSPKQECMGGDRGTLAETYPGYAGIDLPLAWLGVTADPAYLDALKPALSRDTWLGRRAANYQVPPPPVPASRKLQMK